MVITIHPRSLASSVLSDKKYESHYGPVLYMYAFSCNRPRPGTTGPAQACRMYAATTSAHANDNVVVGNCSSSSSHHVHQLSHANNANAALMCLGQQCWQRLRSGCAAPRHEVLDLASLPRY
jgi:hypothetical protein